MSMITDTTPWQWAPLVADQEGDHLDATMIQSMMAYIQSFPQRQALYQKIQEQEIAWITKILEQHHLPTQGDLPPQSLWAADFLARHLRAMALAVLTDSPEPLQAELIWGEIETSLDLPTLLMDLVEHMQRQFSADEQRVAKPHWELLLESGSPPPPAPAPVEEAPAERSGLPTLMEMFV
ncbi:MAG: hypothetical protein OHK0012_13590 [Synechococcales cyanobacterium]